MTIQTIVQTTLILLFPLFIGAQTTTGVYNVKDYGATGDGLTLETEAIQAAIDKCAADGGGKVLIPPGRYLTGPLFLRSQLEVEVQAGATLLADTNIESYPSVDGRWEGIERKVYASLFTGHDLINVSITGRGLLDGQGEVWWAAHFKNREMRREQGLLGREPDNPEGSPLRWPRPRMINLYRCKNVLIRDLTLIDSPAWTVHPVYCEDVTIDNIRIIQPYESPNTDGINPESCRNVRISNCFVDCGDDCITIKSGYNEDGRRVNIACENISITNCTFAHGRSAIGIGSETSGGIRNVTISNCVFQNTYRGLRIKTGRGRGNIVENIRATNIVMENVGTGISLDMFYGNKDSEEPLPVTEETPFFRDIHYSHITGKGIKKAGEILGLPEAPMENVRLIDVQLDAETGLDCRFTSDLYLQNVEVNATTGPAISIYKSTRAELDRVLTRRPLTDSPIVRLEQVNDVIVRDSRTWPGTNVFLEIYGKENKNIQLLNNIVNEAKQPLLYSEGASEKALKQ